MVVAIGALVLLTPLGAVMHFTGLPSPLYPIIALEVVVYLGLVEFGKHLFYRVVAGRPAPRADTRPTGAAPLQVGGCISSKLFY